MPARGTSFLCFAKERKQRKATAGTGLASPNFPHSTRFFGRARNLRLRRFEHASPCFPKNRTSFGCASRRAASLVGWWIFFFLEFIDKGRLPKNNSSGSLWLFGSLGSVGSYFSKRIFVPKTADSRRKPQQGWIPCEDFQRRRCRLWGEKAWKPIDPKPFSQIRI